MPAITREFAATFFAALACRDPEKIAPFVADEAEWLMVGPIELFPYCGQHLGKAAVLAAYARIRERHNSVEQTREFLMTDGESASALTRLTEKQRSTGKLVIVRLAQFARFADGKVHEFCSITDTLGAAEQVLGRQLIGPPDAPALVDL